MIDRAATTLSELDALATGDAFVVFYEPRRSTSGSRISSRRSRSCPSAAARLDQWLERHPDLYRRIEIPAAIKRETRDKLDQANITERVLFPGLEGIARWLARHYAPRPPD